MTDSHNSETPPAEQADAPEHPLTPDPRIPNIDGLIERAREKRAEHAEITRAPVSNIELKRRTGQQVRYSPVLYPWMLAYAEWITLECIAAPKVSQRTARASGLARAPVTKQQIRELEARPDFALYCNELGKGPLERARAKFVQAFPDYIEAHREALGLAREAGDYKALGALAEPVLDRVVPKKAELAQATQVNITLTPAQQAGMTAYAAPAMLVEEVPPLANDSTSEP